MNPEVNTIWQFQGLGLVNERGVGQLQQVVFSDAHEIITIGMPYGTGFSWIGTAHAFRQQFQYKAKLQ